MLLWWSVCRFFMNGLALNMQMTFHLLQNHLHKRFDVGIIRASNDGTIYHHSSIDDVCPSVDHIIFHVPQERKMLFMNIGAVQREDHKVVFILTQGRSRDDDQLYRNAHEFY